MRCSMAGQVCLTVLAETAAALSAIRKAGRWNVQQNCVELERESVQSCQSAVDVQLLWAKTSLWSKASVCWNCVCSFLWQS